jgi:hypothetical protein
LFEGTGGIDCEEVGITVGGNDTFRLFSTWEGLGGTISFSTGQGSETELVIISSFAGLLGLY